MSSLNSWDLLWIIFTPQIINHAVMVVILSLPWSSIVIGVHHATGQKRQERVVMVMKIPRGYIFPHSHHKSAQCPLALFCFLFHCISRSLSSRPSSPSACHTQLSVCFFVLISLSRSLSPPLTFLFLLMSSFVTIFLVFLSLSSLPSSLPVVLTSCPAVEGGRSRGGRGMLILQRRAERELKRQKCHSSEGMRWSLHCECVRLHASSQKRSG